MIGWVYQFFSQKTKNFQSRNGFSSGFAVASDDLSVVVDFFEFHRHLSRHTAFLHGDAVDHVCCGHGLFAVRNDDELGVLKKLIEHAYEASDIGFIEWSIDFI